LHTRRSPPDIPLTIQYHTSSHTLHPSESAFLIPHHHHHHRSLYKKAFSTGHTHISVSPLSIGIIKSFLRSSHSIGASGVGRSNSHSLHQYHGSRTYFFTFSFVSPGMDRSINLLSSMEIGYNIRDIMTRGQSVQEQFYFLAILRGLLETALGSLAWND